jgi:iron-sulfur cluster repair protein YtfE (RIC family)
MENIKNAMVTDFEKTTEILNSLTRELDNHLQLNNQFDTEIAKYLEADSRASMEKQILAIRKEHPEVDELFLNMNLSKHKIDNAKTILSVLSTRQRIADTVYRYNNTSSNLIEG